MKVEWNFFKYPDGTFVEIVYNGFTGDDEKIVEQALVNWRLYLGLSWCKSIFRTKKYFKPYSGSFSVTLQLIRGGVLFYIMRIPF